jgi:hypothetical protein
MTNIPTIGQISSDGNNAGASPLLSKNMALGEAAPTTAGAENGSRSTIPIDPGEKTAPAAPTQGQPFMLGGKLAELAYPLGRQKLPAALVQARVWLVWKYVLLTPTEN